METMNDMFENNEPLVLVGIDEVGRGCLAGPIAACAFAFRAPQERVENLRDSKKMTSLARQRIIPTLEKVGFFGHGECSAAEIDALSIGPANFLAMRRALIEFMEKSKIEPSRLRVVVDGNQRPPFGDMGLGKLQCLVKADDLVPEVSAASVLAKVKRDQWMQEQALLHPGYGFESHAGYGSKQHMQAIQSLGPCGLHRMTFAPLNRISLTL